MGKYHILPVPHYQTTAAIGSHHLRYAKQPRQTNHNAEGDLLIAIYVACDRLKPHYRHQHLLTLLYLNCGC